MEKTTNLPNVVWILRHKNISHSFKFITNLAYLKILEITTAAVSVYHYYRKSTTKSTSPMF